MAWDGWLTLMAPLVAIATALLTRKVVPSLAMGVLVAAVVAARGAFAPAGLGRELECLAGGDGCGELGALSGASSYLFSAVFNPDNLTIVVFTLFVAAMVGVMQQTGATEELVSTVERFARGPRGAMVASWLAGLVVFFDDYANCMVVGKSMGPVCDRNGVSRAKLAYIVDSTAAPVASLTLVSTWVGYEVGLIDQALEGTARAGQGFALFVTALPFRFYGIFALALVGIIALTGRDFGPMLAEELEARRRYVPAEPPPPPTLRVALSAAAPVAVLVIVTLSMMLQGGISALDVPLAAAPLYMVLDGADAYFSMLVGAISGFSVASVAGFAQGRLGTSEWLGATRDGMHTVLEALVILYLAWTLGNAIGATEAQAYLTSLLSGRLDPSLLPVTTFLLASVTAFSTGTSFGTMSILVPLAVPLALELGAGDTTTLAATTAAVLAGSCLGDHASPISDTTVLSAAGANVDLITHVRTQLPYAMLAGAASVFSGYALVAVGLSVWLCLPLGIASMYAVVRVGGREAVA